MYINMYMNMYVYAIYIYMYNVHTCTYTKSPNHLKIPVYNGRSLRMHVCHSRASLVKNLQNMFWT